MKQYTQDSRVYYLPGIEEILVSHSEITHHAIYYFCKVYSEIIISILKYNFLKLRTAKM